MSRRTDLPAGSVPVAAEGAQRRAWSTGELINEVEGLVAEMNRDPHVLEQLAEFDGTTLVLSATDTGREMAIVLDGGGVRVSPYAGEPFDVKIRGTEQVHEAVLFGEMDPDAAFFTGKIRISGSIVTAFRIKNRFLSLLQRHFARKRDAGDQFFTSSR